MTLTQTARVAVEPGGRGPRRRGGDRGRRYPIISLLSACGLVLLWQAVTDWLHLVSPLLLPSPVAVIDRLGLMFVTPYAGSTAGEHLLASLTAVAAGWAVAILIGIPVGIALAWWPPARDYLGIVVDILRPVPPPAWVPFALLWFGISGIGAIFVVFLSAVMPIILNTQDGVRRVDPMLIDAGKTMGARGLTTLRTIVLPGAFPGILTGVRIALGNSWMTVVAAELVASSAGIGYAMRTAQGALQSDIVIGMMLLIGAVGALTSWVVGIASRTIAPWARREDRA